MSPPSATLDQQTRRDFLRALTAASGLIATTKSHATDADKAHADAMALLKPGTEKILILLYPGFTALDAIAPHYVLAGMTGASVKFIAATLDPVPSESGFTVSPQLSFDQCPDKPDLLLIPGGTAGTVQAIENPALLDFVRHTGEASKMAGGICTGGLILGAADLLKGRRATSHWQTLDLLPIVGAEPVKQRVVIDGNRITCGGVTAGLDLGFELLRHYRGDFYAQGVQLLAEYDPQPCFPKAGNPTTAAPEVVALLNHMHSDYVASWGKKLSAVMEKRAK
jgi:cyclohexyl-isocyanide hydratase